MPGSLLILIAAGLVGGFIAGLVGVGGGIIFAPVLLFYFQAAGIPATAIAPLTVGTSLLCTMLTSSVSAFHHFRRGAVIARVALLTGLTSVVGVLATSGFVTTQPWYSARVFQGVFSMVLLFIAFRMFTARHRGESEPNATSESASTTGLTVPKLIGVGGVAGVVSSAVGVGGGIVLVPAFNRLFHLPIHTSVGTSSAAIILISLFGVASYGVLGLGDSFTEYSIGFVDPVRAIVLSIPAAFMTRFGVITAHRFDRSRLQKGFAIFALIVAARLIAKAVAQI